MTSRRPRIEGYAIVSHEGMIALSDGSFPRELEIPADQEFYRQSVARASAIANGRHSAEGGPGQKNRKRLILTRRVQRVVVDPDNPNAVLWNPATASFDEAWQRLGVDDGMLFLTLGYDSFFLTRAAASVPRGRPVFPGIGNGVTPEDVFKQYGMVLRSTRLLDPLTPVEEWVPGS